MFDSLQWNADSLDFSLVCEVHYATPAGLQETFRKFFKFQVMKPLDVKTKFYNADNDEVYLEAQVRVCENCFLSMENHNHFSCSDSEYYGWPDLFGKCWARELWIVYGTVVEYAAERRVRFQVEEYVGTTKQLSVPVLYSSDCCAGRWSKGFETGQ